MENSNIPCGSCNKLDISHESSISKYQECKDCIKNTCKSILVYSKRNNLKLRHIQNVLQDLLMQEDDLAGDSKVQYLLLVCVSEQVLQSKERIHRSMLIKRSEKLLLE